MIKPTFPNYHEAAEYQLREWAEGRPWHNPWSPNGEYGTSRHDGECCPDFSCCAPACLWSRERRYAFVAATGAKRSRLLMGALVNLTDPDKVYVSGSGGMKGADHD